MNRIFRPFSGTRIGGFWAAALLLAVLLPGQAQSGSGAPPMPASMQEQGEAHAAEGGITQAMPITRSGYATYNGKQVPMREAPMNDVGFATPDGAGNVIWIPAPSNRPSAGYMDARELRLKVRELASQLISGVDSSLRGMVALPVSFVNQDDFTQSSTLGRFIAEQLFYEFNQRGFPVREYRMASTLKMKEGEGEFLLSRALPPISARDPKLVFVVGSYYADRQAIFVNARLVRGTDGQVLRTAQLVMAPNTVNRRMLMGSGKTLKAGTMSIRDFKTTTQPVNLSPIDQGQDIH